MRLRCLSPYPSIIALRLLWVKYCQCKRKILLAQAHAGLGAQTSAAGYLAPARKQIKSPSAFSHRVALPYASYGPYCQGVESQRIVISATYASEPQRRVRDFCVSLSDLSEL